jgi:hypothetical protein
MTAGDDRPSPPGLAPFWNEQVQQFAQLEPNSFTDDEKERHRMYSLLVMALIRRFWNGNKLGETGDYGIWRAAQQIATLPDGQHLYEGGTYIGHNIAALAVDGEGRIIDYDFNHNDLFDSSVEHAESRLVRRVFTLNQIYDPWAAEEAADKGATGAKGRRLANRPRNKRRVFATSVSNRRLPDPEARPADGGTPPRIPTKPYTTLLKDVTIYTSLESCAQCSGIMCLGSVKDIVYLQWDQGQFLIGNIMWKATKAQNMGFFAPRPIRGDEFGFEYFTELNVANETFNNDVATHPFYVGPTKQPNTSPGPTSFLCTDRALEIYTAAADELHGWTEAKFPDFKPADVPSALTNQQVLTECRGFLQWAGDVGSRGTPHRV